MKYKTWCLIGVLTVLSFVIFLKGCDQEHSGDQIVAPEGIQAQKVVLRIAQSPEPRAKALRLKLDAVGLNDQDVAVGPVIAPVTLSDPVFPCEVQLTVFKPPCRYRLTISADLTRAPTRAWQDVVNICEPQAGGMTINVFEEFLVGDLSITAPESVNAGDALDVRCEARQIDAPDQDRYPLTLSLSEQGGRTLSSDAPRETASLAETFADPFALTSPETQRLFTCTLADGRSASQVAQKTVSRIPPTPTPTPTPTSTPTPLPTSTPEPPTPQPTATITPIPDTDGDGVLDPDDICPTVPNPHQIATDTDADCRFIDNNNGTITDSSSGRIWLKNADCNGLQDWHTQMAWAAGLASGACGLSDGSTAGQWRLPTRTEFVALLDFTQFDPTLPAGHPFINVQIAWYWASSEYPDATRAWNVYLYSGHVSMEDKTWPNYAWAVR